jgi:hypothetical protein
MISLRLLAVVSAIVIACAVTAAKILHAFSVMGCNFNPGDNPESCINGKINDDTLEPGDRLSCLEDCFPQPQGA